MIVMTFAAQPNVVMNHTQNLQAEISIGHVCSLIAEGADMYSSGEYVKALAL